MTLSRRVFALLTCLLLTTAGFAQTPLGQPTLDEQKAQIWCTTIKFVYGDTGRPNLQSTLRCGGSLKEFENSIKADSQKVYSMLYQPLEARGTMYKGLGSEKSKLTKLTTEIINKLKASPARRKDPARMQGVQALEAQLKGYVENGTPPTDIAAAASANQTDAIDTTATDETVAAPAETGLGGQAVTSPAPRPAGSESIMSKFFAPLALILSLLSIFLYIMLRRSISELGSRADRHRNELDSVKASAGGGTAWAGASDSALTPQLQREIEKLVRQRVAEELGKRPGSTPSPQGPSQGSPSQSQSKQANSPQNPPRSQQSPPNPPRQAPPMAPSAPVQPAAHAAATHTAPAPVAAPESFQETALTPPVMPVGSPASAPRDEFDSLIPPVQLPATPWPEASAPATAPPAAPAPIRLYAKVPVNGSFSEYDLQEQPQHDSIYEITPDPRVPERATFRVTSNPGVHAYAIQSAQYSLRDACAYQQPSGPVSRIVTDKDGTLIKSSGAWQIEQKATIRFE